MPVTTSASEPGFPAAAVCLPLAGFPHLPVSPVLDCLRRLPVRQPGTDVAGRVVWLPRLGVSVLVHGSVAGGWLCTVVAADSRPAVLPVGGFVVSEVEVSTAFATPVPWHTVAALSAAEFVDVWRVRCAVHGRNPMLVGALLEALAPDTLTVVVDDRVRARSGCRSQQGLRQACRRLVECGLLLDLSEPAGRGGDPLPNRTRVASDEVASIVARDPAETQPGPVPDTVPVFGLRLSEPTWPPR